jgi:ABC-2 type transport system permease protein
MDKSGLGRIRALASKDAREFIRDRRTIALMVISAFLFPLLGLMVAGLKTQQKALVAINICDEGAYAEALANLIKEYITKYTPFNTTVVHNASNCGAVPGATVTLMIPRNFSVNASSLGRPVIVRLYKLVGSPAAADAESVINTALSVFSRVLATERVKRLSEIAGLQLNPDYVLEPVRIVSEAVTETGAIASPEAEEKAEIARFLAFAVFFVLNPAAIAVADAVARERESGTGEILAVTPLRGTEFVMGKTLGSISAVAIAGSLDLAAALAYGYAVLAGSTTPISVALFHSLQTILAILVTVSITIFATLLVPGQRTATLLTSLITGTAMLIFFSALFVDIQALPAPIKAIMYIVPYTHTVLAIQSYALGNTVRALEHSLVVVLLSLGLFIGSARVYKPDRLVKR